MKVQHVWQVRLSVFFSEVVKGGVFVSVAALRLIMWAEVRDMDQEKKQQVLNEPTESGWWKNLESAGIYDCSSGLHSHRELTISVQTLTRSD